MDKSAKKRSKKATKKTGGPRFEAEINLDEEEPDIPAASEKIEDDDFKIIKTAHVKMERKQAKEEKAPEIIQPAVQDQSPKIQQHPIPKVDEKIQIQVPSVEIKHEEPIKIIEKEAEARPVESSNVINQSTLAQPAIIAPPPPQHEEEELLTMPQDINAKSSQKPKPKKQVKAKPKKKTEIKTFEITGQMYDALEQDFSQHLVQNIHKEVESKPKIKEEDAEQKNEALPLPKEDVIVVRQIEKEPQLQPKEQAHVESHIIQASNDVSYNKNNAPQAASFEQPQLIKQQAKTIVQPIKQQNKQQTQKQGDFAIVNPPEIEAEDILLQQNLGQLSKKASKPVKKKKAGKSKQSKPKEQIAIDFEEDFIKVEQPIIKQSDNPHLHEVIKQDAKIEQPILQENVQQQSSIGPKVAQKSNQSSISNSQIIAASKQEVQPISQQPKHPQIPKEPQAQVVVQPIKQPKIPDPKIDELEDEISSISLLKPEVKKPKKMTKSSKKAAKNFNLPTPFSLSLQEEKIEEMPVLKEVEIIESISQLKKQQQPAASEQTKKQREIEVNAIQMHEQKEIQKLQIIHDEKPEITNDDNMTVVIEQQSPITKPEVATITEQPKKDTEHTEIPPLSKQIITQIEQLSLDIDLQSKLIQQKPSTKKRGKKQKKEKPPQKKNIFDSSLILDAEQVMEMPPPKIAEIKQQEEAEIVDVQTKPEEQHISKPENSIKIEVNQIEHQSQQIKSEQHNNIQVHMQQPTQQTKKQQIIPISEHKVQQNHHEILNKDDHEHHNQDLKQDQQVKYFQIDAMKPILNSKKPAKKQKTGAKKKPQTNFNQKMTNFLDVSQDIISQQKIVTIEKPQIQHQQALPQTKIEQKMQEIKQVIAEVAPVESKILENEVVNIQNVANKVEIQQKQVQNQQKQQPAAIEIKQQLPKQHEDGDEQDIEIHLMTSNTIKKQNKKSTKKIKPKAKPQIKNATILAEDILAQDPVIEKAPPSIVHIEQPAKAPARQAIEKRSEDEPSQPKPQHKSQKQSTQQAAKIQKPSPSSAQSQKHEIVSELINLIRFHNDAEIRIMRDRMQMLEEDILSRKLRSKELTRKNAKKTDYEWIIQQNIALRNEYRSMDH